MEINVTATERMEEFARGVLRLFPEQRAEFFEQMIRDGLLSAEEADGLKQYVALYHMFADQSYHNKVREAVMEMYLGELIR